ncbi:hypothetical protein DAEQUDRAFT_729618 [Daedalea quercina L-15889]|uniref:Uncharacterized protein n=1 Tax=Daedalea quercina L-15889 TaxID=1314783 RepID=A0A165NIV0_9APHY|nr:hypothetical protein DAEQUDRAFT_729618 [Daedalea quercina L-15889]
MTGRCSLPDLSCNPPASLSVPASASASAIAASCFFPRAVSVRPVLPSILLISLLHNPRPGHHGVGTRST